MKGKEEFLSEVNLMMICYNLRKVVTIFGVGDLQKRLRSLAQSIFSVIEVIGLEIRHLKLRIEIAVQEKFSVIKRAKGLILVPVKNRNVKKRVSAQIPVVQRCQIMG